LAPDLVVLRCSAITQFAVASGAVFGGMEHLLVAAVTVRRLQIVA